MLHAHKIATNNFKEYAVELGLNSASFDTCLSSQSMADEVSADLSAAGQYGATGTPTFFIENEKDGYIKLVGDHLQHFRLKLINNLDNHSKIMICCKKEKERLEFIS